MTIYKVINNNITTHIINSNIIEYNIRKAYPTILGEIDHERFGYLKSLTKDQYINEINELFKTDKTIKPMIEKKTIEIYNEWITRNKITQNNLLATTTDSIIIRDQIAPINEFDDIYFRNKDKITYTSLFYINKDIYILFDRITKKMKIQGNFSDPFINNYPFVKKILKDVCCICNEYTFENKIECLKRLSKLRTKYICSEDKTIYADISHNGDYKYNIDGNILYTADYYPDNDKYLIIDDNYINFMLPLMQSLI
jgi:hypothetical protein